MGIVAIFCCLILLVPSSSAKKVIDGQWSSWGSFSSCSTSCGDGRKVQKRTCSNPPPSNGGKLCVGAEKLSDRCNLRACVRAKGGTCSYTDKYDTNKCKQWYSLCTSKKYKSWLSENCAKTCKCGRCKQTDKQKTSHCQTWKADGLCTDTRWAKWMNWHCKATCKC